MNNLAFNQPSQQPADINPLDAQLAADPDAAAVWSKVRGNVSILVGTFAQLSSLADALFAKVAQINADTRLNTAAKASDETAARNSTLQAIEALRRKAETARDAVLNVTTPIIDPSGFVRGTTSQDTLVMIERTRDAWSRVCMVLDSVKDSGSILTRALGLAKTAAERNDTFTQSALRQNLEAYLEAHSVHMSRAQLVAALNDATAPAASPAMRAAMQIQTVLDRGWTALQGAFLSAERSAKDKNSFRVSGLPGWPGQPPVTI